MHSFALMRAPPVALLLSMHPCFILPPVLCSLCCSVSVPPAIQQRPIFYREVASYMYDPTAYSLANITVELPWLAGIILTSLPIVFFMMGLEASGGVFFFHYLVVLTLATVYVSIGMTLAAAMPTFEVAQALLGLIAPLFFLYGGLWSPPSQMAAGARWFCWIDPITYAFRAIIPPHFYCEGHGLGSGCPTIKAITLNGLTTVDRYDYVAGKYDMNYADRWESLGYLAIFIIVFQLLAILATRYVRHLVR